MAEEDRRGVSEFLLAEFNALQQRAIGLEQNKSTRVNFFAIVAAALVAGIAQLAGNPSLRHVIPAVIGVSSLALALLGLFTLKQSIDDSAAIVMLFRRAARIRLWYVEQNYRVSDYVAFEYGDDYPKMYVPFSGFRGGEAVIFVINSISMCSFVAVVLYPYAKKTAIAAIAATALISWVAQMRYLMRILRNHESSVRERIKFPYDDMARKISRATSVNETSNITTKDS